MILKDISFQSPIDNIAYDDVLLQLAEEGKSEEVLRFWESSEIFIVLGLIGKIEEEIDVDAVKKDKITVVRRSSGGGTVLQGAGCLNYTLVLSKEKTPQAADLKKSYEYILGSVVDILLSNGVQSSFLPVSDIALSGSKKKFSGNAQKRGKNFILHHGTILYSFPLDKIESYLLYPKQVPIYRAGRSHNNFVTNVRLEIEAFKSGLMNVFKADKQQNTISGIEKNYLSSVKLKKQYILGLNG